MPMSNDLGTVLPALQRRQAIEGHRLSQALARALTFDLQPLTEDEAWQQLRACAERFINDRDYPNLARREDWPFWVALNTWDGLEEAFRMEVEAARAEYDFRTAGIALPEPALPFWLVEPSGEEVPATAVAVGAQPASNGAANGIVRGMRVAAAAIRTLIIEIAGAGGVIAQEGRTFFLGQPAPMMQRVPAAARDGARPPEMNLAKSLDVHLPDDDNGARSEATQQEARVTLVRQSGGAPVNLIVIADKPQDPDRLTFRLQRDVEHYPAPALTVRLYPAIQTKDGRVPEQPMATLTLAPDQPSADVTFVLDLDDDDAWDFAQARIEIDEPLPADASTIAAMVESQEESEAGQ